MNIEAILSLLVPFIIGLLLGTIVKKAMNILLLGAILIVILIATGTVSLTYKDFYERAMDVLPRIWENAQDWVSVIQYSSITFLLGLAIGLWRG